MKAKGKRIRRQRKMKVAHVVPFTPMQCGMYETARELAAEERKQGINAYLVDPRPSPKEAKDMRKVRQQDAKCPKCEHDFKITHEEEPIPTRPEDYAEDRGVCVWPVERAVVESDVVVSHSGLDKRWEACAAPWMHVAHGRPNSSYRIERDGETKIYSCYKRMGTDPRWKVMITLWPGYEHYWKLVFPKVRQFPPFVDLERWTPGDGAWEFNKHNENGQITMGESNSGKPNVVVTDIWRKDMDPFHVVHAFALFAEKYPNAKLHVYGLDKEGRGRDTLLTCIQERGWLGEVMPKIREVREVYRKADMLITPHKIATRSVREALACGCQVVAGADNPYTPYNADVEDLPAFAEMMGDAWEDWKEDWVGCQKRNREIAEHEFDVRKTAGMFIDLYKELREAA